MTKKKTVKAVVLAQSDDGKSAVIARHNGTDIELGVLTRADDGQPLDHDRELVQMTPDNDGGYDMESIYRPATLGGRVSSKPLTKAYTKNWDSIFAKNHAGAPQVLN